MKIRVLFMLWNQTKSHRLFLWIALLSAVGSSTAGLLIPISIGRSVDHIVGVGSVDFFGMSGHLLVLFLLVVTSLFLHWRVHVCSSKIAFLTVRELRHLAMERLAHAPLGALEQQSPGDVVSEMVSDMDQISDGLIQGFSHFLMGLVGIVGTLILMLRLNVKLALLVMLLTPLSMVSSFLLGKLSHKEFQAQAKQRGVLGGYAGEMIAGQSLLKCYGYQQQAINTFQQHNETLYACGFKAQFYSSLSNPSTRFVNGVIYASLVLFGGIASVSGTLSIGQLVSFLFYANQYSKPFNEITSVFTALQSALASAERVFALLQLPIEREDDSLAAAIPPSDRMGEVTLEGVSFSYRADQPLIHDLNLSVLPKQRIAIVGPTGCGKTTLIHLLMRFYEISAGQILVGGTPITEMTRGNLRRCYGMVLQQTWLFTGTVRDNIAYGKPSATEEEIRRAAIDAHADGFIRRLPQGYDTVLQGGDSGLSEGERQLLCIARVMLIKPQMLILDEATSNIDTRTEQQISKAFDQMMVGRTSFVVAHRLSTIREADLILVMNAGSIVEQGTHQQLLKRQGLYHELYRSQFETTT